jgi:hypothetical protein
MTPTLTGSVPLFVPQQGDSSNKAVIIGSALGCIGGVAIAAVVYYVAFHGAGQGAAEVVAMQHQVTDVATHAPDGEVIEAHDVQVDDSHSAVDVHEPQYPDPPQRPLYRPQPPTAVVDTAPWWATGGVPPPPATFVSSPFQKLSISAAEPSEIVLRRVKQLDDSVTVLDGRSPARSSRRGSASEEDSGDEDMWFEPDGAN